MPSNMDLARRFYGLPRITAEDRVDLIAMFHPDAHYVGVGKESARGRDAIERLFRKYEQDGRGITDLKFDIRHIAENGNCVLVDMVDSFVIDGRPYSAVGRRWALPWRAPGPCHAVLWRTNSAVTTYRHGPRPVAPIGQQVASAIDEWPALRTTPNPS